MAQTQESTLPGYIKKPTKNALGDIEKWLGSDKNYVYGSKKGESLYTGMNDMQEGAIGNVDWLADQNLDDMFGLNKAEGLWDEYEGAAPELANSQNFSYDITKGLGKAADISMPNFSHTVTQGLGEAGAVSDPRFSYDVTKGLGQAGMLDENAYGRAAPALSTTGIMDESGPLGAIASYISPYLQQVLDPQVREIQEESERQRRSIGASAAMSGAFGDARHGIMEGENFAKTNEAISDTTGRTMADAFLNALTQRQADMGRMDSMKSQDAQLTEAAQGRKLTAGQSNQSMQENALQRQLQGDIQTGQFRQAGATMGLDADKANQAMRENALQRQFQGDVQSGQFKQAGAQMNLDAASRNQASANDALARQLQGDIQTGQNRLAGSQMNQQVELSNQAARQNATERKATTAQAIQGLGNNSLQNFMTVNDALMNAGTIAQSQEELKRQTQQRFQEAVAAKDYNSAIRLLQAAQGSPREGTVTTESDDGLFGILGSILGGLF